MLMQVRPFCRYSKLFAVLLTIYVAEPLLSQVRPAVSVQFVVMSRGCQRAQQPRVLLPLQAVAPKRLALQGRLVAALCCKAKVEVCCNSPLCQLLPGCCNTYVRSCLLAAPNPTQPLPLPTLPARCAS